MKTVLIVSKNIVIKTYRKLVEKYTFKRHQCLYHNSCFLEIYREVYRVHIIYNAQFHFLFWTEESTRVLHLKLFQKVNREHIYKQYKNNNIILLY